MDEKRTLLAELLPLMREHAASPETLEAMGTPEWQERITVENLRFLLGKYRELARLRSRNAGIYERWQASKKPVEE